MGVKRIMCITAWEDNSGIQNENVDILLELDDGYTYVVVLATPQNIEYVMDQDKKNYLRPGHLFSVAKELTKKIVKETIKAYAEEKNGYWSKFYHFVGEIDKTVFEELQAKHIQELKDKKLEDL